MRAPGYIPSNVHVPCHNIRSKPEPAWNNERCLKIPGDVVYVNDPVSEMIRKMLQNYIYLIFIRLEVQQRNNIHTVLRYHSERCNAIVYSYYKQEIVFLFIEMS